MGEKKQKKTASNPLPRKIHIGGEEWSYQIGTSGVNIRNPDLTKTKYVQYTELFGMTVEEVERAKNHKNFLVKPSDVRDYIEKNLVKA